jgi:DNA-binding XRE family transcriptional regulator
VFITSERNITVVPMLEELIHKARSATTGRVELRILVSSNGVEITSLESPPDGHGDAVVDGTFAQWFRALVAERRLSQEAAARRIGVSLKTVSRWLHGTTEPRLRELRRVHEAFGQLPPFPEPESSVGVAPSAPSQEVEATP